jgi:hypothetical protein
MVSAPISPTQRAPYIMARSYRSFPGRCITIVHDALAVIIAEACASRYPTREFDESRARILVEIRQVSALNPLTRELTELNPPRSRSGLVLGLVDLLLTQNLLGKANERASPGGSRTACLVGFG